MRRLSTFSLLALAMSVAVALPVRAATDNAPPHKPEPKPSACVDVEVNGYRSLSYDCLSAQMAAPAKPPHTANPALASEAVTRRAPNQLGLFSQSAFSNRMGSNMGRSAAPQRPPRGNPPPLPMGVPGR